MLVYVDEGVSIEEFGGFKKRAARAAKLRRLTYVARPGLEGMGWVYIDEGASTAEYGESYAFHLALLRHIFTRAYWIFACV